MNSERTKLIEEEWAAREAHGVAWWLAANHHRTHRDTPLDFERNKFQVGILRDQSRKQTYCKSVKCGVSELLIVKALAAIDQAQSVFWVSPDQSIRGRFVAERFDPVIQAVPRYQAYRERARHRTATSGLSADAISLKQLGKGAVIFAGSNSHNQMREAVADVLIIDELDECDQANIQLAVDRLGASLVRGEIRAGNPSIEGYGIDAFYKKSNRQHWFISCEHCNQRQTLDWFKHVVRRVGDDEYVLRDPDYRPLCISCERPIDRLAEGEWVAEFPEREESGYQISQLFSGTRTVKEMHEYFLAGLVDETSSQHFWNSVLGLGYHAEGAKLYHDLLARIVGPYPQAHVGTDCLIGADPGKEIHVVVLDPKGDRIIRIAVLVGDDKWSQLQNMFHAYRAYGMIDCAYDTTKAKEFQAANKGRVFLCDYRTSKHIDKYAVDDDLMVKVDRTQSMDESHAVILQGKIKLPRDAAGVDGFFDQMCAPTRVPVKTKSQFGGEKIQFAWVEGNQADHWRHAFNYAYLLYTIRHRFGAPMVRVVGAPNPRGQAWQS